MGLIFISYRREDAAGHATHIHAELAKGFGREHVFQDITIPPGADWRRLIESTLDRCSVVVAVIGKGWVCKRLSQPDDLLRHELELALKRDILIPVLVDEVPLPRSRDLPAGLRPLLDKQVLWIHNEDFDRGVSKLVGRIRAMRARQQVPRRLRDSLMSPVGWLLAILTGLANGWLGAAWWTAVSAALVVLGVWVSMDLYLSRRS